MRLSYLAASSILIASSLDAQPASRASEGWWSLQPVRSVTPPATAQDTWSRNGIDRFVRRRLNKSSLAPSRPATPRTLVRRLYFDLLGLPPDPQVVEDFERDPSDKAYRGLVDRLLASPHYGERWGRHWLDVARFGESNGFERNTPRNNAWHFRDWVIQALNSDMPHDQFARMQIAGDIERPGIEGAAATGFLVAGLHNTVVGSSKRMKLLARQDELAEIAGAVSQAFLGLTVHCARCHDHKFDPISTRDYYRFISALDGVQHGERTVSSTEAQARLSTTRAALRTLETDLETLDAPARALVLAQRANGDQGARPDRPKPMAAWEFEGNLRDSIGGLHGRAFGSARVEQGALVVDGSGHVITAPLAADLREKTLEAWVLLEDLAQQGGGILGVQTLGGGTFDAIVYGERDKSEWMAGSNSFQRTKRLGGPVEASADKRPVHIAIVYGGDGTITAYRDGSPYGKPYQTGLQSFPKGKCEVTFGIRHTPVGGNRMLRGRILRAGLHGSALSPDAVRACAGAESQYVSEASIIGSLDPTQRQRREALTQNIVDARELVRRLSGQAKTKVFTVKSRKPGVMKIHKRGGVTSFGDAVAPGGIAALRGVDGDFQLAKDASDADRRRALADWITGRGNPLFARVIVNRVWHHHFGTGIVDTPSDLGFNGGQPTHPDLLDWLAGQLREAGYRLKPIHRLIVTSSTYRQSSESVDAAAERDVDNRLLWRHSPRRLDAESLRDALLVVSGRLNKERGGPGFVDVSITPNGGTTYYVAIDPPGPKFERRTVYRFTPRGGRSTLLDTFDCPDPSAATPRRSVTTTPLQALSLLNNSFVLRMAQALAERVAEEAGDDTTRQIQRLYQLTLLRLPRAPEANLAQALVRKHGLRALARALFNSSEFVVVE